MKSDGGFFSRLMKKVSPKESPNTSSSGLAVPTRPGFDEKTGPSGTLTLGLRLLAALKAPDSVISAAGVHMALQVAAAGATKGSINAAEFGALLGRYAPATAGKDGVMTTATAVFCAGDVLQTFAEDAQLEFGAHVAPMPGDAGKVNDWVRQATHGKVDAILDVLPPGAVAVILSAVHFAAPWRDAFDPEDTEDAYFYPAGAQPQAVRMMNLRNRRLWYGVTSVAGGQVQVLEMPYAQDGYAAIAILPAAGMALDAVVAALGGEGGEKVWGTCIAALEYVEMGSVGMPRFKVAYSSKLNDALREQGLKVAFEGDFENGAFNQLTAESATVIKEVLHKATIECTEEGTVAAAATAVTIARSARVNNKPEILLDRPFLFAVRKNDELLFICRVDNVVSPPPPEPAM